MARTVPGIRAALQGSELDGVGGPALRIAEAAASRGGRAYLVGGFVRDWLLGRRSPDLDMEVFGVDSELLRDLLAEVTGRRPEPAGRSFPVFKVFLEAGDVIDVGLPRRDLSTGPGDPDYAIEIDPELELRDAAARRDFSINAVYLDPLTEQIADPFGGTLDLDRRVLRAVDPASFVEDPLRVCRAAQFAGRFELELDPATLQLMRKMVETGQLDSLPSERVSSEVQKLLLQSERPSTGLEVLRETGVCERHFPELFSLIGVEQDSEYHPEGDVWIHTCMVVDAAARIVRRDADQLTGDEPLQILTSALVHDFGKPAVTERVQERVRAHAHELRAEQPIRAFLARLHFPAICLRTALIATSLHLRPGQLESDFERGNLDEKRYANAVRRVLRSMSGVHWRVVLAVVEADLSGRSTSDAREHADRVVRRFRSSVERFDLERQVREPLLRGSDLLALGLPSGPEVGNWIERVEALRDRGELETRDQALDWLRAHLRDQA